MNNLLDFMIVIVLIIIIGVAIVYIVKEKKRGVKCIGCSSGCKCASREEQSKRNSTSYEEHGTCSCSTCNKCKKE